MFGGFFAPQQVASFEYKPRDYYNIAADFEQVCDEAMVEERGLVSSDER